MAENNPDRTRLGRVSQTASVRHERVTARTTKPQVDDNPFDGLQRQGSQPSNSASTSRSRLSQAFTSRGHESPDDVA